MLTATEINKIWFSQVSLSSGRVCVCVCTCVCGCTHTHQNLKHALTLLKINRIASVKTVKYETSNFPFFFLYFASRSENKLVQLV